MTHNATGQMSDVDIRQARELRTITETAGPSVRNAVAVLVRDRKDYLSGRFYQAMMQDPMGSTYLSHQLVEKHLNDSLQNWLLGLFGLDDSDAAVSAILAHQRRAGETHSRIKLPINLVWRSARYLKHWIWELIIQSSDLACEEIEHAVIYVNDIIDLSIEVMNTVFVNDSARVARTDEAYRLFSLSNDLAAESERQRATLMEWGMQAMYAAHAASRPALPNLGQSDFGLWLVHKAQFIFEGSNELGQIMQICNNIDSKIMTHLATSDADRQVLLEDIQQIKFLLASMFDRYLEMENGRDVLTKLFSRRFLHSAMMRQLNMTKQTKEYSFAVLLLDIDHFKTVNDIHGHDSGDMVLQQLAAQVLNDVRAGDFVFRYGGEEILAILVDVDTPAAFSIAEKLREKIEQEKFSITGGQILQVTVSIGIAVHDGHPDAQQMISRADAALYAAKHAGRNRCVLAKD